MNKQTSAPLAPTRAIVTQVTAPTVIKSRSIEEVLKARLMTGQGVKPPMPRMVKVNYDPAVAPLATFVVSKQIINENGDSQAVFEPLADKLKAVIIKIRLQVKGKFIDTEPKPPAIYSYEYDRSQPIIELRQNNAVIARGEYQTLKEQYNLVYITVLYLYLPELKETVRLPLKGASLSGWFDYEKSFNWNESVSDYVTTFSTTKERKGIIDYYPVHLTRGEQTETEKMFNLTMELTEWLNQYEHIRDSQRVDNTVVLEPVDMEIKTEDINF